MPKLNSGLYVLLWISSSCFSSGLLASSSFGDVFAEVVSVYDGDTLRVNIPSYPPIIGKNISIRISGVDTPEIRGKCEQEKRLAEIAKKFVMNALSGAEKVELRNIQRGKYFRIVADVYVDGVNLGDSLIRNGFAVSYGGGRKKYSLVRII